MMYRLVNWLCVLLRALAPDIEYRECKRHQVTIVCTGECGKCLLPEKAAYDYEYALGNLISDYMFRQEDSDG